MCYNESMKSAAYLPAAAAFDFVLECAALSLTAHSL